MQNQIIENPELETNILGLTNEPLNVEIDLTKEEEIINKVNEKLEALFNDEDIVRLLLGKRIDSTLKEVKEYITEIFEEIKETGGNGIVITIYVSNEGTEKLNIIFPNGDTADVEFSLNSSEQKDIKITYLYKNDNQEINLNNGFSLEISKIEKVANTTIKAIYSFIENETINKKITIDLKTEGTTTSKSFVNDIVISYLTSDGEAKVVVDNNIDFSKNPQIENLNEENSISIDDLEDKELSEVMQSLKNKLILVYKDKKENLDFIDTNTHTSIIENKGTIEDARKALINKVSIMMGDAQSNNQEFTIQNLENLELDGYDVTTTITETEALILVDVYMFSIDTNFIITDV